VTSAGEIAPYQLAPSFYIRRGCSLLSTSTSVLHVYFVIGVKFNQKRRSALLGLERFVVPSPYLNTARRAGDISGRKQQLHDEDAHHANSFLRSMVSGNVPLARLPQTLHLACDPLVHMAIGRMHLAIGRMAVDLARGPSGFAFHLGRSSSGQYFDVEYAHAVVVSGDEIRP
jgi:hypothetical protein